MPVQAIRNSGRNVALDPIPFMHLSYEEIGSATLD